MNLSIRCLSLFVALFCSIFALCVFSDDSDFIDEKGKALKNLKGKRLFFFMTFCYDFKT